jgi:hypothetical protein
MLLDTIARDFVQNPSTMAIHHNNIVFLRGNTEDPLISTEQLAKLSPNDVAIFVLGTTGKWVSMVRDENYHSGFGFGSIDKALYLAELRQEQNEEVA